jgi:hypothetical protein
VQASKRFALTSPLLPFAIAFASEAGLSGRNADRFAQRVDRPLTNAVGNFPDFGNLPALVGISCPT